MSVIVDTYTTKESQQSALIEGILKGDRCCNRESLCAYWARLAMMKN
jgi:hypothetical protein